MILNGSTSHSYIHKHIQFFFYFNGDYWQSKCGLAQKRLRRQEKPAEGGYNAFWYFRDVAPPNLKQHDASELNSALRRSPMCVDVNCRYGEFFIDRCRSTTYSANHGCPKIHAGLMSGRWGIAAITFFKICLLLSGDYQSSTQLTAK